MEHTFDHTWITGDCEAVFRITCEVVHGGSFLWPRLSADHFDVECIAIKLQDEDGTAWHEEVKGGLSLDMEERFKRAEGKRLRKLKEDDDPDAYGPEPEVTESESNEAIEALCLKDYERE